MYERLGVSGYTSSGDFSAKRKLELYEEKYECTTSLFVEEFEEKWIIRGLVLLVVLCMMWGLSADLLVRTCYNKAASFEITTRTR